MRCYKVWTTCRSLRINSFADRCGSIAADYQPFHDFWNNYPINLLDVCPVFEDLSTLLRIFVYQFICFGRINIHVCFLLFWICLWRAGFEKSHFGCNFSIKKHAEKCMQLQKLQNFATVVRNVELRFEGLAYNKSLL